MVLLPWGCFEKFEIVSKARGRSAVLRTRGVGHGQSPCPTLRDVMLRVLVLGVVGESDLAGPAVRRVTELAPGSRPHRRRSHRSGRCRGPPCRWPPPGRARRRPAPTGATCSAEVILLALAAHRLSSLPHRVCRPIAIAIVFTGSTLRISVSSVRQAPSGTRLDELHHVVRVRPVEAAADRRPTSG